MAGCDLNPFSSKVACDDVNSSEWKSGPSARTYEFAEAIDRCGTFKGKSRAQIERWMGPSQYYANKRQMGWDLDAEDNGDSLDSDWPMITITLDRNGKFNR